MGLIKSVSYYLAITLEAFVFCFAGEFLSAKVCKRFFNILETTDKIIYSCRKSCN